MAFWRIGNKPLPEWGRCHVVSPDNNELKIMFMKIDVWIILFIFIPGCCGNRRWAYPRSGWSGFLWNGNSGGQTFLVHSLRRCQTAWVSSSNFGCRNEQSGKFEPAKMIIAVPVNSLRLRQNGRHFADDTFKRIFLNENVLISIKISLKFVPKGPINNIPALVQIMAWRRPGDKPLSEPRMVSLPTHICVTRPQWINPFRPSDSYMHQQTMPALVQIMACRLFGAKPSSELMLAYCWLDTWEQILVKFE